MEIKWTNAADQDLDSIAEYIFQDNPQSANKQVLQIIHLVEAYLALNPGMGRKGRVSNTRELVVGGSPYIVVYRVQRNILQILRVIHGAMKWPEESD